MQQDELTNLKELFIKMDTDKNGSLAKEELAVGLKGASCLELFVQGNSGEDSSQALLERMDIDNDGKVDYLEFI